MSRERRPRSVYGVGQEPDPRTSLANERTALAGMRTALGLVVAGVGLAAITHTSLDRQGYQSIAIVLCLSGALLSLTTVRRWVLVERALRLQRPLPEPTALPLLAVVLCLIGLGLAIVLAIDLVG